MSENNAKAPAQSAAPGQEIDIDELEVDILMLAKNPGQHSGSASFLSKRGWNTNVIGNVSKVIEYISKNKPDFVLISFNHPNPTVTKLPDLLTNTFKVTVVGFVETSDPKAVAKLNAARLKYKVVGMPSGPNLQRTIRKILIEKYQPEAANEGSEKTKEKNEKDDIIRAKGGKNNAGESDAIQVKGQRSTGSKDSQGLIDDSTLMDDSSEDVVNQRGRKKSQIGGLDDGSLMSDDSSVDHSTSVASGERVDSSQDEGAQVVSSGQQKKRRGLPLPGESSDEGDDGPGVILARGQKRKGSKLGYQGSGDEEEVDENGAILAGSGRRKKNKLGLGTLGDESSDSDGEGVSASEGGESEEGGYSGGRRRRAGKRLVDIEANEGEVGSEGNVGSESDADSEMEGSSRGRRRGRKLKDLLPGSLNDDDGDESNTDSGYSDEDGVSASRGVHIQEGIESKQNTPGFKGTKKKKLKELNQEKALDEVSDEELEQELGAELDHELMGQNASSNGSEKSPEQKQERGKKLRELAARKRKERADALAKAQAEALLHEQSGEGSASENNNSVLENEGLASVPFGEAGGLPVHGSESTAANESTQGSESNAASLSAIESGLTGKGAANAVSAVSGSANAASGNALTTDPASNATAAIDATTASGAMATTEKLLEPLPTQTMFSKEAADRSNPMTKLIEESLREVCQPQASQELLRVDQAHVMNAFIVNHANSKGLLVINSGGDQPLDDKLINDLISSLNRKIKSTPPVEAIEESGVISTPLISFKEWSQAEAIFSIQSQHEQREVIASYFPLDKKFESPKPFGSSDMSVVAIDEFTTKFPVNFKAYLHFAKNDRMYLYLRNGRILQEKQLAKFKKHKIGELLIKNIDLKNYRLFSLQKHIFEMIEKFLLNKTQTTKKDAA